MPYPEEFGIPFEDFGTIRIVQIEGLLPAHATKTYSTRKEWAVRKILVHHHAGNAHDTNPKNTAGVPRACVATADFFIRADNPATPAPEGRNWAGYAYHYDIPYHDEIVDGRRIVYRTQSPTRISFHTGAGQNEMGMGISLIGNLRGPDQPTGASYSPDTGNPSAHQRAAGPELVRYLQEHYGISDLHVQAHFQHGKPACPGWDFEFWVMHREERPRRDGQAFCWPISLEASDTTPHPFLRRPADELDRTRRYLANTRDGGSGFYPFGRQFLWHNGVHLFPANGRRAEVYAVRDGWVVGARLNKNVVIDGRDYGSANFVLVLHEDPGLYDPLDDRSITPGSRQSPRRLKYYSLYLHVDPLDTTYAWLAKLQTRDVDRYNAITAAPDQAWHFASVAIPVKAGELIAHVGQHNAFAARDSAVAPAHPEIFDAPHQRVLHFEMFALENPLVWADPDSTMGERWTIADLDADAFATDALTKLDRIDGIADADLTALRDAGAAADRTDPTFQDPSVWLDHLTPALNNTLSKVITRHRSEWGANWNTVIDRHFLAWGLDRAGADHMKRVVAAFQWWDQLLTGATGYPSNDTGLRRTDKPHFFHPIRFLAWLNGLERVLDHSPSAGIDAMGFPICLAPASDFDHYYNARFTTRAAAVAGATTLQISAVDEARLLDSSFRLTGSRTVHSITAHTAISGGWELTIDPPLPADVPRGRRLKLGNYGWHWQTHFAWDTDLV